jgi:hypothetical protein
MLLPFRRYPSAVRTLVLGIAAASLATPCRSQDLAELEARVIDIFSQSCATVGCHAGSDPQLGMSLEADQFFGHTVGAPSRERADLSIIHPGRPDSSYLIKKVRGDEDIIGARMPMTGNSLSDAEIEAIEAWVSALGDADLSERTEGAAAKTTSAFDGWKVVNLPSTRMVDARTWLFLIGHRFNPQISAGYDALWGLDGSGIILLSMGYAPTNDLLFTVGRSNAADDVELQAKARLLQQTLDERTPLSLALQATVNWITERSGDAERIRPEAFKFSGQLVASRELAQGVGVLVVPGVLVNQDERTEDEHVLLTAGLGARWRFHQNLSLVAEWVPILSGYARTTTFGNINRFDAWGGGLEIAVGGHVFQIVVTNAVGIATDQYLRGGDLDIGEGDLRLGFNIFRLLRF